MLTQIQIIGPATARAVQDKAAGSAALRLDRHATYLPDYPRAFVGRLVITPPRYEEMASARKGRLSSIR
jgi:hypothetical protein